MDEPSNNSGSPVAEAYEFPSLTVLKETHMELLRQEPRVEGDEITPKFLNRVKTFMRRASATGRILEDDVERGIAQTLLSYWVTVLYRHGIPEDSMPASFLIELDDTAGRDLDDSQCPYRGFAAYSESSAHLFFGRTHVIDDWIAALKKKPVLVVLGASGAGKTSLIRAGLLPALKKDRVPGSADWEVKEVTLSKENPRKDLRSAMEVVVQRTRALLVIHRLDGLFLSCDRAVGREMMDALHSWVTEPGTDRHIVVSARLKLAGVLTSRLRESKLAKVGTTVFIPPFDARELRAVIERPAEQIGLRFEEGLVDTLINDFLGDPAALALLQFMLLKLWDARERNRITWAAYEACGGGMRVVEQTAESVYHAAEFDERDRDLVKTIFVRLVRPSLTAELVSESVPMSALASTPDEGRRVEKIIDRFEKARLLQLRKDLVGGQFVEVSHEALLRKWPRMLEWLEDSRLEMLQKQRVSMAAAQWREQGRDRSALWTGVLLASALSIREQLSVDEMKFVDASVKAANRRRLRNRILIAAGFVILVLLATREYYLGKKTEAALNLERAERLVKAGDPAGAFIFFQQAASVDPDLLGANSEWHKLRVSTTLRQLPRLVELRHLPELELAELSPDGTFLLGATRKGDPQKKESEGAVRIWRLDAGAPSEGVDLLKDHLYGAVKGVAIHPNPSFPLVAVAVSSPKREGELAPGGKILVFNAKTREQVGKTIPFPDSVPEQVRFHPGNSKLLLVLSRDSEGHRVDRAGVWNYMTGDPEKIFGADEGNPRLDEPVNWIAFSDDGALAVIAGGDLSDRTGMAKGKVWVWDWKWGKTVALPHEGGPISFVEFDSSEGLPAHGESGSNFHQLRLVTAEQSGDGSSGAARVWSVRKVENAPLQEEDVSALTRPFLHRAAVLSARFSPDGRFIASAGRDRTARLWHIETQKEVLTFRHDGDVFDVEFSPDGRLLATGGRDRVARIWEVATGRLVMPPLYHSETVSKVAFSNDGRRLVTTSKHLARIWETEPREPEAHLLDLDSPILSAVSGDGQRLLTVDRKEDHEEKNVELWNSRTGDVVASRNEENVTGVALDRDGSRMAIACHGAGVRIFDVTSTEDKTETGELSQFKLSTSRDISILAFDADAERVAAVLPGDSSGKSEVAICDLEEQTLLRLGGTDENPIEEVLFGPKGNLLLAISNEVRADRRGRAILWNLDDPTQPPAKLYHDTVISCAAFSRDGKWLLTGGTDDDARLWKLPIEEGYKGEVLKKDSSQPDSHTHTADVTSVIFSPDSTMALTGSKDQTAILWRLGDDGKARQVTVLRHEASVRNISFSSDGELILTASDEPALRLWNASDAELIALLSPKGEVAQSGFGTENDSLFAVVQEFTREVASTKALNSGGTKSIREIRPTTWNLKPYDLKEPENLARLLAARQLESADLHLPPWMEFAEGTVLAARQLISGDRSKRKALENAPTGNLPELWREVKGDRKLLGSDQRSPVSYHDDEAKECEILNQGFAEAWHLGKLLDKLPKDSANIDERAKLLLRRAKAIQNAPNRLYGLTSALSDLEEAMKLGRNGVDDHARIGKVYLELGKWDPAIKALQRAAELDPKNPERQINLGEAYAGTRNFKGAKEAFEKAGELAQANKPERDIAPARLAFTALLSTDWNKYEEECKRIQDQNPNDWASYALLWPSVLTEYFGDDENFLGKVEECARIWCDDDPGNYYRRNTYGAALYRAGKFKEAITELETSRALHIAETASKLSNDYDQLIRVQTSPTPEGRPVDWVFLAMANAKLDRRTEAWDWMRKLLVMPQFKDRQGVPTDVKDKRPVPYDSLALELLFDEAYTLLRSQSARQSQ